MATATITPTIPAHVFTGEEQSLRRERVTQGAHRTWTILPRIGTGPEDRWTVLGSPIPAPGNPAADFEDGQYATLAEATEARDAAELLDTGDHLED